MFELRRAFEECDLRALALDADLHTQWREQRVGPRSRNDAYRVGLVDTAGAVDDSRGASTAIRNFRDGCIGREVRTVTFRGGRQ